MPHTGLGRSPAPADWRCPAGGPAEWAGTGWSGERAPLSLGTPSAPGTVSAPRSRCWPCHGQSSPEGGRAGAPVRPVLCPVGMPNSPPSSSSGASCSWGSGTGPLASLGAGSVVAVGPGMGPVHQTASSEARRPRSAVSEGSPRSPRCCPRVPLSRPPLSLWLAADSERREHPERPLCGAGLARQLGHTLSPSQSPKPPAWVGVAMGHGCCLRRCSGPLHPPPPTPTPHTVHSRARPPTMPVGEEGPTLTPTSLPRPPCWRAGPRRGAGGGGGGAVLGRGPGPAPGSRLPSLAALPAAPGFRGSPCRCPSPCGGLSGLRAP